MNKTKKTAKAETKKINGDSGTFSARNKGILISVLSFIALTCAILISLSILASGKGYYVGDGKVNFVKENATAAQLASKDGGQTGGNVPAAYQAIFGEMLVIAVVGLFVGGSGLRGSTGINKKNPFIKGKKYTRTKEQKIVFRFIVMIGATLAIGSFIMDMTFGSFLENDAPLGFGKDIFKNGIREKIINKGILSPSAGYFQCYLSSLFVFIAIARRKYNGMPVLLPLATLGSARTFLDINDGTDDAAGKSIGFHRFMMVHALIVILPVFIIFANRQVMTLQLTKRTILYTFGMVFIAYIMYNTATIVEESGTTPHAMVAGDITGPGEVTGAAFLIGKDESGVASNFNVYFGLIEVPFGFAIIVAFYLMINMPQFKTGKEQLTTTDGADFKKSFYMSQRIMNAFTKEEKVKVEKVKYVPFGN